MIDIHDELYKDIEAVQQIPMLSTMLDVICRTTGMRFAAVARVTECRWLACSVHDDLNFGLEAGNELAIRDTICSEVFHKHNTIIINDIEHNDDIRHNEVLKLYGLKSYISFPIILKNGEFFGTLCAVDNTASQLDDPQIIGTFALLTDLLAFHLQTLDIMQRSHSALKDTNIQLSYTLDENMLYRQSPYYNLQEPLRKISLYSDLLVNNTETADVQKTKNIALKIHSITKELANKIDHASEISELTTNATAFEQVNLNSTLNSLLTQLGPKLFEKNIAVENDPLPSLRAVPVQMTQLLFHLLNFAITFSKKDSSIDVIIRAKSTGPDEVKPLQPTDVTSGCFELTVTQNGLDIEMAEVENILSFFGNITNEPVAENYISGLAYCRKIVHYHGGSISAQLNHANAIHFSVTLPLNYYPV